MLAGPRDCGKSLLQSLLTILFGGRSAKPYRYMTGETSFNADLFGAEHLVIEDEQPNTDIRARRNFGAQIKEFTSNPMQSCHGKFREAVGLGQTHGYQRPGRDRRRRTLMAAPCEAVRRMAAEPDTTATSAERTARFAVVDTLGHLLAMVVTRATAQERAQVSDLAKQVCSALQAVWSLKVMTIPGLGQRRPGSGKSCDRAWQHPCCISLCPNGF